MKRLITILLRLAERVPGLEVRLFCEPWQLKQIEGWNSYQTLDERAVLTRCAVQLPLQWSADPRDYGDWLWRWHATFAAWDLATFDMVFSDNLIEPLVYTPRVILSGSFLWHDVLATAFPEYPAIQQYRQWAEELLRSQAPTMLVNRYFAMPATERHTRAVKIGFVSAYAGSPTTADPRFSRDVLIALGNTHAAEGLLTQLVEMLPSLRAQRLRLWAAPRWQGALAAHHKDVRPYDFSRHRFQTVGLAIVRAGLGTIADCVAARIPMLYLEDRNPEIAFNQIRLSELGIGLALREAVGRADVMGADVYSVIADRFQDLRLTGDLEAADVLARGWMN